MFGPFYFPFSCNKDYAMQVEITAKNGHMEGLPSLRLHCKSRI